MTVLLTTPRKLSMKPGLVKTLAVTAWRKRAHGVTVRVLDILPEAISWIRSQLASTRTNLKQTKNAELSLPDITQTTDFQLQRPQVAMRLEQSILSVWTKSTASKSVESEVELRLSTRHYPRWSTKLLNVLLATSCATIKVNSTQRSATHKM